MNNQGKVCEDKESEVVLMSSKCPQSNDGSVWNGNIVPMGMKSVDKGSNDIEEKQLGITSKLNIRKPLGSTQSDKGYMSNDDSLETDVPEERLNGNSDSNSRVQISTSMDPECKENTKESFHFDFVDTTKGGSSTTNLTSNKFPGLTPFNGVTSSVGGMQTTASDGTNADGRDSTDSPPNSGVTSVDKEKNEKQLGNSTKPNIRKSLGSAQSDKGYMSNDDSLEMDVPDERYDNSNSNRLQINISIDPAGQENTVEETILVDTTQDVAEEGMNGRQTYKHPIDISTDLEGGQERDVKVCYYYDSVDTPKVNNTTRNMTSTKFPGLTPFGSITSNTSIAQTTESDCTDFGGKDSTDSAPNSAVPPENENADGPFGRGHQQSQQQSQQKQQPSQNVPNMAQSSSTSIDDTFSYPVTSTPRGYFLLVNNKDFLPESTMESYPRNGTDVDSAAVAQLFQDLGFLVDVQRNLRVKEIMSAVKRLVNMDYSNVSCVGCCFLSHGKEGILYGVDGEVQIKNITACFQKNPALVGKPKLFFFQACQGSEYMDSVQPLCQVDGPGDRLYGNSISLPTEADFLYAYSTVPGYYSWRNSQNGSWFIQALVEVFRANAHKMDVVRMLTRVNNIVCTKKSATGQSPSHNKQQVCSIVTQLRYELFLYPPNGPLNSINY